MKSLIKEFIPPIILNTLKINSSNIWSGDYTDWELASKDSTSYCQTQILDRVIESTRKVKNGEAAFERDSVAFNKIEYDFPLLASLLYISNHTDKLNVLDFGGSLGSTYFQYKNILKDVDVNWFIIEQEHFAKQGKNLFETSKLKFFRNLDEIDSASDIQVVLIKNSLQYMEEPYKMLDIILSKEIKFIIFYLVAFNAENRDRLTVQNVPKHIYEASYPCWFLNENKFLEKLNKHYKIIWEIPGQKIANIPSQHKGFLFERST